MSTTPKRDPFWERGVFLLLAFADSIGMRIKGALHRIEDDLDEKYDWIYDCLDWRLFELWIKIWS